MNKTIIKSFPVYLGDKLFIRFKKKCIENNTSMNEVIRGFIKEYLRAKK